MNALDQNFFLRISTELYQKRLISGGFEKVYTLGPNFRNEGLSDEHLPEYTQVEWYWAYADYNDNMELVEEMFKYFAKAVYGKSTFTTRGHTFDLDQKWERISYPDIIKERYGVDIFTTPDADIAAILKKEGVRLDGLVNRNRLIDNLWKLIRKGISGPAFLINEPAFMSPLSKSREDVPELTERFHVLIAGSELGNGYSELNNPLEQFARFRDQQAQRDQGDDEAQMMDIDYVEMLEYGMPPTSGYAHSERVFWFLEDVTARQGTIFPALKHKIDPITRKIYDLPEEKKPSINSPKK
jgi:lysyl-tRNA synthetase class 2